MSQTNEEAASNEEQLSLARQARADAWRANRIAILAVVIAAISMIIAAISLTVSALDVD